MTENTPNSSKVTYNVQWPFQAFWESENCFLHQTKLRARSCFSSSLVTNCKAQFKWLGLCDQNTHCRWFLPLSSFMTGSTYVRLHKKLLGKHAILRVSTCCQDLSLFYNYRVVFFRSDYLVLFHYSFLWRSDKIEICLDLKANQKNPTNQIWVVSS